MDFLNDGKIWLGIFFIIPGFVSQQVFDLVLARDRRRWGDEIVAVFAYSVANLVIWHSLIAKLVTTGDISTTARILGLALCVFVSPAVLGWVFAQILKSTWLNEWIRSPYATAWDFRFSTLEEAWVICHLRDGRAIGGFMSSRSFTSSHPYAKDLYIEQVWKLDERYSFVEAVKGSGGMLVSMSDCTLVEFIENENKGASRQ